MEIGKTRINPVILSIKWNWSHPYKRIAFSILTDIKHTYVYTHVYVWVCLLTRTRSKGISVVVNTPGPCQILFFTFLSHSKEPGLLRETVVPELGHRKYKINPAHITVSLWASTNREVGRAPTMVPRSLTMEIHPPVQIIMELGQWRELMKRLKMKKAGNTQNRIEVWPIPTKSLEMETWKLTPQPHCASIVTLLCGQLCLS